ncbi:hypothetical protein CTheo_8651 [Ceratobasidium theobromae]|uniref:Uncharacterized protein n=1 Tax=Ceratobasidium theobromae TaxID=1582974 RepID=A0A5N5Q929_9AGAM|nr:hypothetical protein CTheo_8651 [Ceratobasidium theobromae]
MKARPKPKDGCDLIARFLTAMRDADVKNLPNPVTVGRLTVTSPEFNSLLDSILAKWPHADLFEIIKYLTPCPDEPGGDTGTEQQRGFLYLSDSEKAWVATYYGETVNLLKTAIDNMNASRGNCDYTNFIPIIQSSGTGKSRAVDELAKQIFTIPLNLSLPGDQDDFPVGDEGLLDLLNVGSCKPPVRAYTLYDIFFKHLFNEVEGALRKLPPQNSQSELALVFHSHLELHRQGIYRTVTKRTRQEIWAVSEDTEYINQALASAKSLIELIQSKSGTTVATDQKKQAQLLIYFDESHLLALTTPEYNNQYGLTCYQYLILAINELKGLDLFFIFLSTEPKTTSRSFLESIVLSGQGRIVDIEKFQAPFKRLPFNQWKEDYPLKEDTHTLEDVCSPGFMVRFGRPL